MTQPRRAQLRRPRLGRPREEENTEQRPRRWRVAVEQLGGRVQVLGVLGACVLASLLFGPVFGSSFPTAVYVPVLTVAAIGYLCFELARAVKVFEQWRAVASVVLGLLAIVETTLHRTTASWLPTGASIRALYDGARHSWLRTLQSTLPARAEPKLVIFVPLLMLAAMVVSIQIVTRTRARLASLLPALLLAGLSQAYHPITPRVAVLVVAGFAVAAAAVLGTAPQMSLRRGRLIAIALIPAIVLGTLLGVAVDPARRTAYDLQRVVAPQSAPKEFIDPLSDIAAQLEHPDQKMFAVRGRVGDVARWPLVVYTAFDGVTWTHKGALRNMGARLNVNQPTSVPAVPHHATVTLTGLPGPWVPSQTGLQRVSGINPQVYQDTGTLVFVHAQDGTHYQLGYTTPKLPSRLTGGGLTPHLAASVTGLHLSGAWLNLVHKIVGDASPTFHTALVLERYLSANYRRATGARVPSGHSVRQIARFLFTSKVGTSEQFASAYVLLARIIGIPARLVVGYRQGRRQADGSFRVSSGDVLAWPEVSVQGIGWVGLDPTSTARGQNAPDPPTSHRSDSKSHQSTAPPKSSKPESGNGGHHHHPRSSSLHANDGTNWWLVTLFGFLGLVVLALLSWVIGVPAAKWLRNRARRRRHGNDAIVSAWFETRDLLRDHGVVISSDMTVRDVRHVSRSLVNAPASAALERLADLVDSAMWSGAGAMNRYPPDIAWGACDTVRKSLLSRPITERLAANLTMRSLRPLA